MAENWYVLQNGRRHGPYTGAELKRQAATGQLLPIDLVVKDGMEKPVPAAKVKGLFDAQSVQKPPVPPAPRDTFDTAPEAARPVARRPAPGPKRTKLYLLLGGSGLLAVMVVIAVVVIASGRKPSVAEKDADAAKSVTTVGKNGSSAGSRRSLSPAARESKEYERGYKHGTDVAKGTITGNAKMLEDHRPAFRASALKSLNKPKHDFETSYQDLLKTHGPDHDATLLYRGLLDGYMDEVAKAGITLD